MTKYTLNGSLAKQKGKSQIEVHLGSGQATNWSTQRATPLVWMTIPAPMHQLDLNSLPAMHIENWINPDQFTNQLMGPSRAKGRIVVGGVVKKIRQQGMRPVFQEGDHQTPLQNSPSTSTPSKHWQASVFCLMEQRRGMWLASFQLYQPNKVKAYQTTNTYNRLIEPVDATSAATNMTSLLKPLTTKNIKQKLGKGTASSQGNNGGGGVSQTFSFVVPYSSNHTNNGTTGPIKTAYPVKKDEASQVAINSLINATPLNS